MKKTAVAPTNIAFIKYWGRKDEVLRLPTNGSISMNLSGLSTFTTVEFDRKYAKGDFDDRMILDDDLPDAQDNFVVEMINQKQKELETIIYILFEK